MSDETGPGSPDAIVLRHALEKLRTREGLTLERVAANRDGVAAPLLELAAVRRYAAVHGKELPEAALDVVRACVRDALEVTSRIVADAILALGALYDIEPDAILLPGVAQLLKSDSLGRRRRALLTNWDLLHEVFQADLTTVPSDRVLRGATERAVLTELAHQLIRREVYSIGAMSAPLPGEVLADVAGRPHRGRVIVVGGAVMDATFRTRSLPQVDTSHEATDFDLSPGGKGLTQAVAAAKLGLDVSIVAAVADDRFGNEILDYLRAEGVDTSMVKVVPDARTPFTGIIELEFGDSIAINWRNDRQVRLDVRDVVRLADRLAASDALLVTFEAPRETVQEVLALAHVDEGRRPIVVVTPGQPYPDGRLSNQALNRVDYLVAHPWELAGYASLDLVDLDETARRLLAFGVETLCVPIGGGCAIYSELLGSFTVPTFPSIYKESSVARDAFCAALAGRLIDGLGEFTEDVALWATAAMASATADHPVSNSMPDRRRIERLLSRSRFRVLPKGGARSAPQPDWRGERLGGASGALAEDQ